MDEALSISAMPIADKVIRYLNARYYAVQLAALEKAAGNIGCSFVERSAADAMTPEVEEYLAIAVILARENYIRPKCSGGQHYKNAEFQLEDGYAIALFREIVAALDAIGLRFKIREQGVDSSALESERREWKKPDIELAELVSCAESIPPLSGDGETDPAESAEFMNRFFEVVQNQGGHVHERG
ncbi:hypothetical protein [Azohydromonas lata]|uniref:hypothetical protein n=1 Tax=Azohydromonas lata TaxID=45677 RepID=UPI0012F4AFC2|nr:hypothetical protein [Azohydromonas lata]